MFGHPTGCCNHSKTSTIWLYHRVMSPKDAEGIANSVDPDQTPPLRAAWSESALFAQTCLSENLGSLRYYASPKRTISLDQSTMFQGLFGFYLQTCLNLFEPPHDKTNKMACAPSKDWDQPGHLPNLIRVFAVRFMDSLWPNSSSCGQQRLWSDRADA